MPKYKYEVVNCNTNKRLAKLSLSTKVELSDTEKREYLWQWALDNQVNINRLSLKTVVIE